MIHQVTKWNLDVGANTKIKWWWIIPSESGPAFLFTGFVQKSTVVSQTSLGQTYLFFQTSQAIFHVYGTIGLRGLMCQDDRRAHDQRRPLMYSSKYIMGRKFLNFELILICLIKCKKINKCTGNHQCNKILHFSGNHREFSSIRPDFSTPMTIFSAFQDPSEFLQ